MLLGITLFTVSACDESVPPIVEDDTYELIDLTGKTQAEIETLFADIDLVITYRNIQTSDVEAGKFIRYVGYQVGSEVKLGSQLIIEIAVSVPEAPVITGASDATVYV